MSRLYKRGNVYWYDFSISGKRYRESTEKTKRREAEDVLKNKEIEIDNLEHPATKKSVKKRKFAELANQYAKWADRQKSYARSKKYLIQQLVDVFGNDDINDLNSLVIDQLQSKRLKHNKPATVNRLITCLKHMVNKGLEWEMVNNSTAEKIRKVKLIKEDNKRLRFLTLDECQALINCCQEHLKPIVTIALHSGMRKGEILNLKWEQVDLRHGFILLEKTKNGDRREIPINTTLEELFDNLPTGLASGFVFTNKNGKPYCEIKHSFQSALKKAGITDFRFHDLRHTFASQLVMMGIDLTTVKELLGHKTLTMTLRYAHLAPGHKKKAVNTLDKVMRKQEDNNLRHNLRHSELNKPEDDNLRHNRGTNLYNQ